jgi:branched-chain amino acid transport system ATP-binding protein
MSEFVLETRGLVKSFGALRVTNQVSIALAPGARHALIGPNGAGKSTLVGLISGTIQPDAGTVSIFGRNVTHAAPAKRTKLGLVRTFQITSLFSKLTVLENLYLAVSEHRRESLDLWRPAARRSATVGRAEALLEQFRLTEFANKNVSVLPYGQQRLVEIALALAVEPKVLLLDEPAAGIPSGETRLLMDAIERLPESIAILLIEHDMALVRRFARDATLLVHGGVVASTSVREILTSRDVREVYLGKLGETPRDEGRAHA